MYPKNLLNFIHFFRPELIFCQTYITVEKVFWQMRRIKAKNGEKMQKNSKNIAIDDE
jgi:hypothetical protein